MRSADLAALNCKKLAQMAKLRGIRGWHQMRKQELVDALSVAADTPTGPSNGNGKARGSENGHSGSHPPRRQAEFIPRTRNGAVDRLTARVVDPFWVELSWELTQQIIGRAEAALGSEWHGAQAVIRVCEFLQQEAMGDSAIHRRDISIHGDVDRWFVPVGNTPKTLQFTIGYRGTGGKFFALAKSGVIETAQPRLQPEGGEEQQPSPNGHSRPGGRRSRLQQVLNVRPASLQSLVECREGKHGGTSNGNGNEFAFQLDAELVVFGTTHPRAEVSFQGTHIPVAADGSFAMRFSLPNGRQILPVVAVTPDGCEERTVLLAVERNTKQLEPQPMKN